MEESAKSLPERTSGGALAPTTTEQQDITTAGQRKVNLIWEYTQAFISIVVVVTVMGISSFQVIAGRTEQIPTIFSIAFGTVIGFYFSRTNHQAIGGTGSKPDQPYQGR